MNEPLSDRLTDSQPPVIEALRRILFLLAPYDPVGVAQRRYGKDHDGGYVMLESWPEAGVAYSFGISDDVSWDTAMAAKGLPVYMYDHTIAALPCENAHFHWSPIGLGETDRPEEKLLSLKTLLQNNGHQGRRDLVLKMDIEGAEWAAFLSFPEQILMEFHDCSHLENAGHVETMCRVFERLNASHRVVHIHANNYGRYDLVGGIPFPSVLEVSYVRKDVCAVVPSQRTFPTPLDMPNKADRADYVLPFWGVSLSNQVEAEDRAAQAEFQARQAENHARQARHEAEQAKDEARLARRDQERAEDAARQAENRTQQVNDAVEHLREQVRRIHSSTSWRITRPLRGLKRLATGDFSPLWQLMNAARRFFFFHPGLARVLRRAGSPQKVLSPHAARLDKWLRFAARHPQTSPVLPDPVEERARTDAPRADLRERL